MYVQSGCCGFNILLVTVDTVYVAFLGVGVFELQGGLSGPSLGNGTRSPFVKGFDEGHLNSPSCHAMAP